MKEGNLMGVVSRALLKLLGDFQHGDCSQVFHGAILDLDVDIRFSPSLCEDLERDRPGLSGRKNQGLLRKKGSRRPRLAMSAYLGLWGSKDLLQLRPRP